MRPTIHRRALLGGAAGLLAAGVAPARAALADTAAEHPATATVDNDLIALRRAIHRHPEAAGQEERTAAVVARRLRAAGLDVTTGIGGHGVVGVLDGAHPGRTIAYRADMDAVPPDEQINGGPRADVAHVCGHDIHTTVGVGVAEALARRRHRLAGRLVFVFQPGEEALIGAAAMLRDGVLERFRPVEIHALHCGPFPVGTFVVNPGIGLPGQDIGAVTLTGPGAEIRARDLGTAIAALGTVARPGSPADLEKLVADLERPHSPLARFVFMQAGVRPPDTTRVQISYRCWPENRFAEVRADIERLARSYGPATVSFPAAPFPAMVCPEPEAQALRRHLRQTIGRDRVVTAHGLIPYNGEDFALFLKRMPGTFTFLGVRRPHAGIETSYPHYVTFDPDERAIGHGVRAMTSFLPTRTRRPF